MKINIAANTINPHLLMQKAGYHALPNDSYVMHLSSGYYPRFHVYFTKNEKSDLILALHLDQTPAVYENVRAHKGEYDSEVVRKEGERLMRWVQYFQSINHT